MTSGRREGETKACVLGANSGARPCWNLGHRTGFCIYSRSSGKGGVIIAVEGRSSMIRSVFAEEAGFMGLSVENGLERSQETERKAPRNFAAI